LGPEIAINLVHERRAQGEPELEMSTQQAVDQALELVSASNLQHLAFPTESQVESAVLQGIGRNLNLTGEMVDPAFDSLGTGLLLRSYPDTTEPESLTTQMENGNTLSAESRNFISELPGQPLGTHDEFLPTIFDRSWGLEDADFQGIMGTIVSENQFSIRHPSNK
jgi:hypothetical protein